MLASLFIRRNIESKRPLSSTKEKDKVLYNYVLQLKRSNALSENRYAKHLRENRQGSVCGLIQHPRVPRALSLALRHPSAYLIAKVVWNVQVAKVAFVGGSNTNALTFGKSKKSF